MSFYNDALSILAQVPDHLGKGLCQSPLAVCAHVDPWGSPCQVPDGG